jgi:hypothetical protein
MRHFLPAAGARHDVLKLFPPLSDAIEFIYHVIEVAELGLDVIFSTGMSI